MTALTVTARLGSIWLPGRGGGMLDGPLAWAWASRATSTGRHLPPLRHDQPPADFPLPLGTWEVGESWGWRTSRALPDVVALTAVQVRRKPAVEAMARYAPDRKHHAALGPMKARDTTLAGTLARTIEWHVDCTDEDDLRDLLRHVTHLGARHRNGFGEVLEWAITPGPVDGWRDRPMPDKDGHVAMRPRAPYWHHDGRTPHA